MNILLLGGTGAMGISLCEILNEQGHTIYVTSRSHHADYGNVHYDRLFDRVFDSEKICRLNPALEFTSMQEGLKKCLTGFVEAYKEKNVFLPINWRNEAYRDRLTGEHSSFSEMKGWRNKLKYVLYRYTWFMQYRCRG